MLQCFTIFKMTSKMAEIAGCGLWNHMGSVMIHCTKTITYLFFRNGYVFYVCPCSGNRTFY